VRELLHFLLTILGGAIGSAVTLWLGSRQFRSQRWWDRKAETYLSIVDAFQPLLDEDSEYWDATIRRAEVPEERQKALRVSARAATAEIQRRQRLGRFLISEEAEMALRKMEDDLANAGRETDWTSYREKTSAALFDGFDAVKSAASSDLGVAPISLSRFRSLFR
jgi:hypothetical protein